jgi:hypothetical protein
VNILASYVKARWAAIHNDLNPVHALRRFYYSLFFHAIVRTYPSSVSFLAFREFHFLGFPIFRLAGLLDVFHTLKPVPFSLRVVMVKPWVWPARKALICWPLVWTMVDSPVCIAMMRTVSGERCMWLELHSIS